MSNCEVSSPHEINMSVKNKSVNSVFMILSYCKPNVISRANDLPSLQLVLKLLVVDRDISDFCRLKDKLRADLAVFNIDYNP
jgi:hypothetical protein